MAPRQQPALCKTPARPGFDCTACDIFRNAMASTKKQAASAAMDTSDAAAPTKITFDKPNVGSHLVEKNDDMVRSQHLVGLRGAVPPSASEC